MSKERFDIHQRLTDRIVSAIEAGAGEWQMPWRRGSGGRHPVNIASGNKYRGVNVLGLWVDAQVNGYSSHLWGTFRQWADKGATVRKGQKASYVVFHKEIEVDADDQGENDSKPGFLVVQAVMLERTHELSEPIVELVHDEAVEGNTSVQQPEKSDCWQQCDVRVTQRNDVVFARLLFEYRTFAEPRIGRKSRKGYRLSSFGKVSDLDQSVNHANPDIRWLALVAHEIAVLKFANDDGAARAL
jgi:hypothetical protein